MSFRSSLLIAGIMGNRWRATSAPASGTTCVAQVSAPNSSGSRLNVESIWYSIKNETAANATVGVQVRDATTTGSVIARVEHVLLPATGFNGFFPNMAVVGNRGSGLAIMMDTVISSVSQSINATGWTEDSPSLPIDLTPSFSLLFKDLGAGAVDTSEQFGRYAPTFTRATAAWTRLSTGLWASVSSGVARSYYDINGVYRGYLSESSATARGTFARDLTNAAWAATNVTVAKDQVGIDGAANSASSLVATAGNGTVLQAITLALGTRVFQPFVKRLTGTGQILITLDNFATTTDITSLISTGAWTDLGVVFKTQTLANPVFGFKIVTSGDKIAVDMADLVDGTFGSSPINATSRNADTLTYPITAGAAATMLMQVFLTNASNGQHLGGISDGTTNNRLYDFFIDATPNIEAFCSNGGVTQFSLILVSGSSGTGYKLISAAQVNDAIGAANGTLSAGDTSVSMPTVNKLEVGIIAGGNNSYSATKMIAVYPTRLPNGVLQQLTT